MASVKIDSPNTAKSQSCPWGKKQVPAPVCSFASVMDEEYAKQLQNEEDNIQKCTETDAEYAKQLQQQEENKQKLHATENQSSSLQTQGRLDI